MTTISCSPACCDVTKGVIWVYADPHRVGRILNLIVFESANLSQTHDFRKAMASAKNADDYAKRMYQVEWRTIKITYDALVGPDGRAKTTWYDDHTLRQCRYHLNDYANFEQFWEGEKNSEHAQAYRNQWLEAHSK